MMPVVDAHVQLRNPKVFACPLPSPLPLPSLQSEPRASVAARMTTSSQQYLLNDYLGESRKIHVLRAVHVQAAATGRNALAETAWLQEIATTPGSGGLPNGIVANADLMDPEVEAQLEAMSIYKNVRGIHQPLNILSRPGLFSARSNCLVNPRWVERFAMLEPLGLSFDLQIDPHQLQNAACLAQRYPSTLVILNHAGLLLDRSPPGMTQWRDGLRRFASCDNARIKVSGFGLMDNQWTVECIRPIVQDIIDRFGFERVMFASHFPAERHCCSYDDVWTSYSAVTSHISALNRDRLFRTNAMSVYRLG